MQIGIIASGSRGDVQPYIALARGLQKNGHTVKFISQENYADMLAKHAIEFWPVSGNVQAIAQSPELSATLERGNFLRIMKIMAAEAEKVAINLAQVVLRACEGADLILGGIGGLDIGIAIAERLELPVIPAYLLPFTPTKQFPSVLTPSLPNWLQPVLNPASHRLAKQVMWQSLRKADEAARREVLGIPPAPFFGPYQAKPLQGMPTLYAFSASVIPRPRDWPEQARITGYWFLEADEAWQPPQNMVDFLASGPPPVYIGFGSMHNRDPEATTNLIIAAVLKSKQRAVLQAGWGGLQASDLPDSIMLIDSIPHTWLFPQMAAVVHHGGVGTTASGLRAGVPNLVVPYFGDQPFWGARVAQLGVGPAPIPRKKLTLEGLASALEVLVSNSEFRSKAKKLGQQIRGENGVRKATEIIAQRFAA